MRLAPLIIVAVIDGDTIKVLWHGEPTSVRLLNVNAPDRGQDGFDKATASASCRRVGSE